MCPHILDFDWNTKRRSLSLLAAVVLLSAIAPSKAFPQAETADDAKVAKTRSALLRSLTAKDIENKPFYAFPKDSGLCVITFVTTTCPIANSYQPELEALRSKFEHRGVTFVQVIPSPRVSSEQALKHRKEFHIAMPTLIDSELAIAQSLQAQVTPETFLVDRDGRVLYRGRISDLYAGYGKKRRVATQHDLANAINAVLTGSPIQSPRTKAIGCVIRYP